MLQEPLTRIIGSHVPDANDLNKLIYDTNTTDLDVTLEDAIAIPFLSDCKVILIYHMNFLSAANEHMVDTAALGRYLDNPLESTVLILTGDFEKLSARKKIVKEVQKTCKML